VDPRRARLVAFDHCAVDPVVVFVSIALHLSKRRLLIAFRYRKS
jgi:hypothetical protein